MRLNKKQKKLYSSIDANLVKDSALSFHENDRVKILKMVVLKVYGIYNICNKC